MIVVNWFVSLLLLAVGFLAGLLALLFYIVLSVIALTLVFLLRMKSRILSALRWSLQFPAAVIVGIYGLYRRATLAN
jgi:hypothetical protein